MFVYFNPNPSEQKVGDCVVRAISKATGNDWEKTYIDICCEGLKYYDMPSSNYVFGMYLNRNGFTMHPMQNICPSCTTVERFSDEHDNGTFVLVCQNHVVASVDGDYFDTWESGNEIVLYYWQKEE